MRNVKLFAVIWIVIIMFCQDQVYGQSATKADFTKPSIAGLLNQSDARTVNRDQLTETIRPLCYQETEVGNVIPCDGANAFPACFNFWTRTIRPCKELSYLPLFPLCIKPTLHLRFVVTCSKTPIYLCFATTSGMKTLEFCKEIGVKSCLGNSNVLHPCDLRRSKRNLPEIPPLETDGYYAACENCSIVVVMLVDENDSPDKIPIIEIQAEPLKDDEQKKLLTTKQDNEDEDDDDDDE